MEADNVNNTVMEIRNKERQVRRSKSRSMTPMTNSNSAEVVEHVKNDISSSKVTVERKSVMSTKSVSKTKTYGLTTGKNTILVNETHSSQEDSRSLQNIIPEETEMVTNMVTRNDNRPMELRSERQRGTRQTNKSIANGTGSEETVVTTSTSNSVTSRAANRSQAHRRRTFPLQTSDYSSDDDDQDTAIRDDHSQKILNVYRGEFWNKLPKTDFTYSPISKDYYREVAPGVSVKPNMSRSSYQSYSAGKAYSNTNPTFITPPSHSSSTRGVHSTGTTTSSRRSRFFDASKTGSRVPAYINDFASPDSDEDEVDTRVRATVAAQAVQPPTLVTFFTSFFSTIWTLITTTWTTTVETTRRVLGLQTDSTRYGYSTPIRKQEQHQSWWKRMLSFFYILPALATGADLALLSSTTERGRSKRLRLFAGLLFLLLLLLCGWLLYAFVPEETKAHTSVFLSKTQNAIGDWFGTFGGWFRMLWGWILLPFATRKTEQNEYMSSMRVDDYESRQVPSLTIATSSLPATPPTTYDINILMEQLLTSQQFEQFIDSKLGKFNRDDLIKEIFANSLFTNWIALKFNEREVDVEILTQKILASGRFGEAVKTSQKPVDISLLATNIWNSGQLQQFIDAYLNERKQAWLFAQAEYEEKMKQREEMNIELMRASLQQELDEKSKYFEIHNSKLASEIELLKTDMEKKLNASIYELKGKLNEELSNSEDLKRAQEEEINLLKMQLKKCCNKAAPPLPVDDIEKYVLRYVAGLYGMSSPESVTQAEMQALMGNLFVGRQQFEAALANVSAHHKLEMKEVSEQSAQILMDTISERISEEFVMHQKLHLAAAGSSDFHGSDSGSSTLFAGGAVGLTDSQVMEIVNRAIMTYDADKTGMVDYALESSGGSIINTRCTESYYKHSASMSLFGIPYWYPSNTPRTVIQPGVHPGQCWAFRGSQGFLVIQLAGLVRISSFSLEHIPRTLAFNGNIDSAPKDFSVWGLEKENDPEPTELGKYTYLKNSTSLQYFIVKRSDVQPFRIIELRIGSNHGNLEYTCLYRFRVHGTWVSY